VAAGLEGSEKFAVMGDLLGRLHAPPFDESVSRHGGASGDDPSREGSPRQDLMAALAFLDAVHTRIAPAERERLEAVMYIRPLYLGCFSYRRDLINGRAPGQEVWGFADPENIGAIAAATRAAYRR
jgi:hypothetical protein